MPAYLLTLNREKSGHTLVNGGDAMVIFAASGAIAKEMAAAKFDGDGAAWVTDGTATEIVAGADFNGWTFRITIRAGFGVGGAYPATVEAIGTAANETVDKIAALLVIALNALDGIAGAAYVGATNTLTIAETTDGLGDQEVDVSIIPPAGLGAVTLAGTITDGGVAGAALTVILPLDAGVIPKVLAVVKQT